jgi:hypothetical protein
MFGKKKSPDSPANAPVLRGRTDPAPERDSQRRAADNPLARRFRADAEPATIDLGGPARFPADADRGDPETTELGTDASKLGRVISHDPETGKFYIHPGTADLPVTLQGEPVLAPTELRRGDTIRVGSMEIRFGATL